MSTDYRLLKKVPARDLFDGRLEEFTVREHVNPDETTETNRCLTDGRNYLWVSIDDDGFVSGLTRYGLYGFNMPDKIINAVANAFDVDIASEDEPQYWGCNTQEELDAKMEVFAATIWPKKILRSRCRKIRTSFGARSS